MRPVGTAVELERRRRRAVQLLQEGHSLATVAQRVGAAVSAVWLWWKVFREQGAASLAPRPTPGRPPKLTARQRQRLVRVLARGARAAGHSNELWTTRRIAHLIEREFGVRYHPAHVSRILAECGWSWQKPARRAVERDEAAIAQWKRYRWVEIKKKARRLSASLVFLDESGFLLLPTVRCTWAPRGQTPVVRHRYERTKISAISAVTVSPRRHRCGLYACFHFENISHVEVAHFLPARRRTL